MSFCTRIIPYLCCGGITQTPRGFYYIYHNLSHRCRSILYSYLENSREVTLSRCAYAFSLQHLLPRESHKAGQADV